MITKTKKGKSSNYTVISNSILSDKNLSFQAKGILCYLVYEYPHENSVNPFIYSEVLDNCPNGGRAEAKSALNGLGSKGYINIHLVWN